MLVRIQSLLLVLALVFIAIEHAPWSPADAARQPAYVTRAQLCEALNRLHVEMNPFVQPWEFRRELDGLFYVRWGEDWRENPACPALFK